MGVEKFVPSLESLFSLGFEGENLGWEFCRDVPDPWKCSKLSGHYSRDWSESVYVIGVISETFAREFR